MLLRRSLRQLSSANDFNFPLDSPQPEPIELVWSQGQQIWQIADSRKDVSSEHLNQNIPPIGLQVQFHGLRLAGKVVDHEHSLGAEFPEVCKHAMVCRIEKFDRTAAQ